MNSKSYSSIFILFLILGIGLIFLSAFIGSSVAESPTQFDSNTNITQQNSERIFSSYNQLSGSSIQQGQTIVLDVDQANIAIQLRERTGPETTRLRAQLQSDSNGNVEIDTSDLRSADYFVYSSRNTIVEFPVAVEDTFSIYTTQSANVENTDESFNSYNNLADSTLWRGQVFDIELPIPNAEVEIRESLNQTTRIRGSFQTNDNGRVAIDAGGLNSGEFYLTGAGVNSDNSQQDGTFQIESQSLEANFEPSRISETQQSSTDLAFSSNRFTYPVTVSATNRFGDGLSTQQLTNAFEEAGQLIVTETNSRDSTPDTVTLRTADEDGVVDFDQYTIDLSGVSQGRYTFSFDVADTTASATSDIVLGEVDSTQTDGSVRFSSYDTLSNQAIWIGQTVVVDGLESNTDIQVRKRIDDQSTRLVQEIRTNSSGTATIETASYLSGDYYIMGGGVDVDGTNSENTFQLFSQTLSVTFNQNSVGNTAQSTTFYEIDSNRAGYPITIHANGKLSAAELQRIFVTNPNTSFDEVTTLQGSNGISEFDEIRIEDVTDSDTYELNFADINAGTYEFVFLGTDSIAATKDKITVTEGTGDQVQISNVDLLPSTVTNSSSDHSLTFDVKNMSADGRQDTFSVEIPSSVDLINVNDVTVTNEEYDVSHSTNANEIDFTVNPDQSKDNVDLSFNVDLTLAKSQ